MIARVPLHHSGRGAFTIVELLAATAVFIGLMLMLVTATNQTGDMWRRSSAKIEQFQQARRGFESMTRRLSQATLNTYWDYDYDVDTNGNPDRTRPPKGYVRQSELRFRSGYMSKLIATNDGGVRPTHGVFFQAPLGMVEDDVVTKVDPAKTHRPLYGLLNTWGYFVQVDDDAQIVPDFLKGTIPPRVRSRLMELMEPSETFKMDNPSQVVEIDANGNKIIKKSDKNWDDPAYLDWFATPVKARTHVRVLAENVLALVIHPRLTQQDEVARANANKKDILSPLYDYDSKRFSNQKGADTAATTRAPDSDLNPKNQLPPVVLVTMVAIDEASARRLDVLMPGDRSYGLGLDKLFLDARKLETPEEGDLAKLEEKLIAMKLTYRIFSSNVGIRGAKWSRSEK